MKTERRSTGAEPNNETVDEALKNKLKARLLDLIEANLSQTFAEILERNIKGWDGEYMFFIPGRPDLVIWTNMSGEACDALGELLREKKIFALPSVPLVYLYDGRALTLPVAKRAKPPYKTPHWAPTILHSKESFEAIERARAERTPRSRRGP